MRHTFIQAVVSGDFSVFFGKINQNGSYARSWVSDFSVFLKVEHIYNDD